MKSPGWISHVNSYRRRVFRFNFYRCHLAYFILTILITSGVLWGASPHGHSISYPDALFLSASAMTTTGLNTVNLNVLGGYQQSILLVLMVLGDLSVVSIGVVVVRRIFFRRSIDAWTKKSHTAREVLRKVDEELANGSAQHHASHTRDQGTSTTHDTRLLHKRHERSFGGLVAPWETRGFSKLVHKSGAWTKNRHTAPGSHHYLSFEPTLDSKARIRNLNHQDYQELGGVEFRALGLLCWILPLYTAFWICTSLVLLATYASAHGAVADTIRTSQPGNLSPAWWGVFASASSYTNCGLDLLNSSMIPFRSNWLILIVTGAAIVAGNTFYPIFLRVFVWLLTLVFPADSKIHHSLSFLLHHPRRCYLWLFDRKTTLTLTAVQFGLIFTEWVLFEILNINQSAVWDIPRGPRIMDGLYQSLGPRSSGYYIVSITDIAPALQLIYMVVMYLSVFPLIVSLRSSNVYEERSVGLQADIYQGNKQQDNDKEKQTPKVSTGSHVRNQLAYDLWWIMLSWTLICVIEEPSLNTDAPGFNNFAILFEVVSAYGNCGLTLGVPYDSFALSGAFHTLSKLILITVMLRGRHRILLMAIDRSILVPGQRLMEEMDRHYSPDLKERHAIEYQIREAERGAQAESAEAGEGEERDDNNKEE
ncbi:hypothetical protein ANO11243_009850 [Dothideomycetidae sp. 11243]|nr:hypothetical protein ANO11243_009850 [fungal sp. No.11243]